MGCESAPVFEICTDPIRETVGRSDHQGLAPGTAAGFELYPGMWHTEDLCQKADQVVIGLAVHGWGGDAHLEPRILS